VSYRSEQTGHLPALTDAELAEVEAALRDRLEELTIYSETPEGLERAAITRSVLTAVRELRMHLSEIRPPSG
jgi:hypothetical protein